MCCWPPTARSDHRCCNWSSSDGNARGHRQVIVELLARYLRVDLCRDDVRMSQHTAHALDGHTL